MQVIDLIVSVLQMIDPTGSSTDLQEAAEDIFMFEAEIANVSWFVKWLYAN